MEFVWVSTFWQKFIEYFKNGNRGKTPGALFAWI